MSSVNKFVMNTRGVAHFLRCKEMRDALDAMAARIQPEADFVHGGQGHTRYTVLIHTNTPDETLRRFYGEAEN